jgi:RsiW-degrading membrane proteinase PrsW (M82 family)
MFLEFIQQYPFVLAFIIGLVPAMVWLWFWLSEDKHHEPARMLTLSFLGGMAAVIVVLPCQKFVYNQFGGEGLIPFGLWAVLEELAKFLFVYFIALRNKKITDEPIDDIIYLIVSALGFVTLENTLFLVDLIKDGDFVGTIINGNLRFIGASLLHIMSSATIGICMALSFYKTKLQKRIYTLSGLIIAIVLHTAFNLFIIRESEGNIFFVFGAVWLSIVVLLLLFEKVKNIKSNNLEPQN